MQIRKRLHSLYRSIDRLRDKKWISHVRVPPDSRLAARQTRVIFVARSPSSARRRMEPNIPRPHETNATERRDAGSKEVCCYETHGKRSPPMNRRRAVSPSQGQRPLAKARDTQDLRRRGAHGSTDPPAQSQDGRHRTGIQKTTSLSKPPRRQAGRKRRRHPRRTRLARPFMELPVVLLALDGAVVGGLAPRTFPEPALLRAAGPAFYFHLRQWRRRRGVVRRLSLRVP